MNLSLVVAAAAELAMVVGKALGLPFRPDGGASSSGHLALLRKLLF